MPGIKIGGGPTPMYSFTLAANELFTQVNVQLGTMKCGGLTVSGLCSLQLSSNLRSFETISVACSVITSSTLYFGAGLAYIGGNTVSGCITGLAFFYYG